MAYYETQMQTNSLYTEKKIVLFKYVLQENNYFSFSTLKCHVLFNVLLAFSENYFKVNLTSIF